MTYRAAVWHSSKRARIKGLGPAAKLITLQNKCLRSITGAYRNTNTKVLEAESGETPLDIHLNQAVLRARDVQRCGEVICLARGKIRSRLRGKRGRRSQRKDTPRSVRDAGAKDIMD